MKNFLKTLLIERQKILKSKGYDLDKDYTFIAYACNENQKNLKERRYNDNFYV